MDKWLVVWHEDQSALNYFVLQANEDASDEYLHELADGEINKILTDDANSTDYYIDLVINITSLEAGDYSYISEPVSEDN